jgi:histidine triad (HIT) family protein
MSTSCIFCKIASKQIPSQMAFEEDELVAFHDITPVAPTHILVIPKQHIESLNNATPSEQALLGKLLLAARRAAVEAGLVEGGFRVVINSGKNAGQSVFHVHLHVLGGRAMGWPPG